MDVILDYANNLYIADYQNFRIQKYIRGSSTGQTVAGNGTMGTDPYQLNRALRVIPDSQENLYVADSNNQRVQYWTKDGQSVTTVAGKTGKTRRMAICLHSNQPHTTIRSFFWQRH